MKRIGPLSKRQHHFLTFVGKARHPVVGHTPCEFLSLRIPKHLAVNQHHEYREAVR